MATGTGGGQIEVAGGSSKSKDVQDQIPSPHESKVSLFTADLERALLKKSVISVFVLVVLWNVSVSTDFASDSWQETVP